MKFEITKAALKHSLIATTISGVAFWLFGHPMFLFLGTYGYGWRETTDLEKRYGWKLGPINADGAQWNSAEFLGPLISNAALAALVWAIGGF